MDYAQIDRIMTAKGLLNDLAFGEDLYIAIQPMPNLNGCPLGLYYPDQSLIALPLNASEAALLHELGHRHGHFYYDNLSERYAENFRERYQGGGALLYQGDNFKNLPKFGALFEEGEKGAVEIALLQPLAPGQLYEIKSQLAGYGEVAPKVCYGNNETPWVRFEFTKGVDWLVIIGSVMAASVLATVGALGYAVYKVSETLPWVVPTVLFGTGLFFFMRGITREASKRIPARV